VTPAAGAPSHAGVQSHRVIFIDLARSLAVVFMLYGHAVSALLAPDYQQGSWFDVWTFQRGLTSSLFLLLSGFAFSIATVRHWASHLYLSRQVFARARRFVVFILLGYALHFPVPRFIDLATAGDERWRSFLVVDVLQLIGVTFLGIQLLVLVTRTRWIFTGVALATAVAMVVVTPTLWLVDWPAHLPLWAASYLEQDTGSLFPLFPWTAYILLGAALGQVYSRWGASNLPMFANRGLLAPGTVMVVSGLLLESAAPRLFGGGPWTFIPPQVLVRAGSCLLILGGIAHGSRIIDRLPRIFGAVAQETLLIYFVHLCIVYGSIWGPGLYQIWPHRLAPVQVFGVVVALIAAMTALAWQWNWIKHRSPPVARGISWAMAVLLTLPLLW